MKSMTGYGQGRLQRREFDLEVGVKTVNGRFFELRLHVPREYSSFEGEIKKQISALICRGTVDVYIHRRLAAEAIATEVEVRSDLARKWLKSYQLLGRQVGLEAEISLSTVASLPEVMKVKESYALVKGERQAVLSTVKRAVQACQQERVREGRFLKRDLNGYFSQLEQHVKTMKRLRGQANKELGKRLRGRWESLKYPGSLDPQRLAQEIVVQIDKGDINEELTRLSEHLRAMKRLLRGAQSQGKKMDFYSQELLREVNTIGSKSQIARLTESVVDAKAIIERIREQVQNVE